MFTCFIDHCFYFLYVYAKFNGMSVYIEIKDLEKKFLPLSKGFIKTIKFDNLKFVHNCTDTDFSTVSVFINENSSPENIVISKDLNNPNSYEFSRPKIDIDKEIDGIFIKFNALKDIKDFNILLYYDLS